MATDTSNGNGKGNRILREIKDLLASDGNDLSARVLNRMVLAMLVELDERISGVEDALDSITPAVKATMWVGAALGLSLIGLLWSVIVGQASIVFN